MSLRSTVSGIVLASLGAAAVVALTVALSPQVRRRALELSGRSVSTDPEQPTHIVLPDRAVAAWPGLGAAIDEGRAVGAGDIALAGA
jgi:hypothetical protein